MLRKCTCICDLPHTLYPQTFGITRFCKGAFLSSFFEHSICIPVTASTACDTQYHLEEASTAALEIVSPFPTHDVSATAPTAPATGWVEFGLENLERSS